MFINDIVKRMIISIHEVHLFISKKEKYFFMLLETWFYGLSIKLVWVLKS